MQEIPGRSDRSDAIPKPHFRADFVSIRDYNSEIFRKVFPTNTNPELWSDITDDSGDFDDVEKDEVKAAEAFKKAAELGHMKAKKWVSQYGKTN